MTETTLHAHLKKTIQLLTAHLKEWDELSSGCEKPTVAIGTFSEQLACCLEKRSKPIPLLQQFPKLSVKLEETITNCIYENLGTLASNLQELGNLDQRLKMSTDTALRYYKDNWIAFIESLQKGSATRPSLAEVLEWVGDLAAFYHQEYILMRNAIDFYNVRDPKTLGILKAAFTERRLFPHLEIIIAQLNSFVESDGVH